MNLPKKTDAVEPTSGSRYLIETEYFGVSDEGIHLLRERFNYETIPWQDMRLVKIHRDRELHNWFAVFCISGGVVVTGLYYASEILDTFLETSGWRLLRVYALVLLSTSFGAYFLFKSVRKTWVLRIQTKTNERIKFPVEEVYQQRQIKELEAIMKKNFTKV